MKDDLVTIIRFAWSLWFRYFQGHQFLRQFYNSKKRNHLKIRTRMFSDLWLRIHNWNSKWRIQVDRHSNTSYWILKIKMLPLFVFVCFRGHWLRNIGSLLQNSKWRFQDGDLLLITIIRFGTNARLDVFWVVNNDFNVRV